MKTPRPRSLLRRFFSGISRWRWPGGRRRYGPTLAPGTAAAVAAVAAAALLGGCEQRPASPSKDREEARDRRDEERVKQAGRDAGATAQDYLDRAKQSVGRAGDEAARQKDELQRRLARRQEELRPQIQDLQRRADAAGGQAKEELQKQAAALQERSRRLDEDFNKVKNASADAFAAFRARLEREFSSPAPAASPEGRDDRERRR